MAATTRAKRKEAATEGVRRRKGTKGSKGTRATKVTKRSADRATKRDKPGRKGDKVAVPCNKPAPPPPTQEAVPPSTVTRPGQGTIISPRSAESSLTSRNVSSRLRPRPEGLSPAGALDVDSPIAEAPTPDVDEATRVAALSPVKAVSTPLSVTPASTRVSAAKQVATPGARPSRFLRSSKREPVGTSPTRPPSRASAIASSISMRVAARRRDRQQVRKEMAASVNPDIAALHKLRDERPLMEAELQRLRIERESRLNRILNKLDWLTSKHNQGDQSLPNRDHNIPHHQHPPPVAAHSHVINGSKVTPAISAISATPAISAEAAVAAQCVSSIIAASLLESTHSVLEDGSLADEDGDEADEFLTICEDGTIMRVTALCVEVASDSRPVVRVEPHSLATT